MHLMAKAGVLSELPLNFVLFECNEPVLARHITLDWELLLEWGILHTRATHCNLMQRQVPPYFQCP